MAVSSGVVLVRTGSSYRVHTAGGEVTAVLRGRLRRRDDDRVVAGDVVDLELRPDGPATISRIHPRRSVLARRAAGQRSPRAQPLAANVDQVVVVAAVRDPEPNLRLLDRFLVIAEANRIPPVIVLNKIELERGAEQVVRRRFAPAGYQVLPTSVRAAEGLAALRDLLRGRASVLTGESGVGKSSLMNALHPGLNLRIGEVSAYWGKGKHTTRAALLVPLAEHGFVVDTPGLREVGTWGVDPDALGGCFPEFRRFLDGCRFDNCRHLAEPDCAVRRAAEAGTFDPDRLLSYPKGNLEVSQPDGKLRLEHLRAQKPWLRADSRVEPGPRRGAGDRSPLGRAVDRRARLGSEDVGVMPGASAIVCLNSHRAEPEEGSAVGVQNRYGFLRRAGELDPPVVHEYGVDDEVRCEGLHRAHHRPGGRTSAVGLRRRPRLPHGE